MVEEKEITRNDKIHQKGFSMTRDGQEYKTIGSDYKKIKIGVQTIEDANLNLGTLKHPSMRFPYWDKRAIHKAIIENNIPVLREISNHFYKTNGIYSRVCNYFSFLYRYDWYIAPELEQSDDPGDPAIKKLLKDFDKLLSFLDNTNIRKICGDIALQVIINGCYYGYIVPTGDRLVIQDLPVNYCRSVWNKDGLPIVEFNMAFFDRFKDPQYRMKVLNMFPDEFKKGYLLYKQGKLVQEDIAIVNMPKRIWNEPIRDGWYVLDPGSCIKFNFNNSDTPLFINAIPELINLDEAQDLDRKKQMQQLLKIIVQKLPLDKNGDLIFDIDEARDIHNNACQMLSRAIGVDVITTFADVESIDISDTRASTATDDLERIERTTFNAFGISQNLFNTDGNLSLEKSILNDESSVRSLLLQFTMFFDKVCEKIIPNKKHRMRFYMLETTQYNYKELAKLYKEQTAMGYSKLLPQIALGHSQSFILNSINFENKYLHLSEIMIPPLTSNTMNGQDLLGMTGKSNSGNSDNNSGTGKTTIKTEENKGGRPEKEESQKSEKTIQNQESMS